MSAYAPDPLTAANEQRTLLYAGAANSSINSNTHTGGACASRKRSKQAAARSDDVLHAVPITPHPALAIGTSHFAS